MKAEELRIGNYVCLKYMSSKICVIESIERNKCILYIEKDDIRNNTINVYIKPIPLTEEWLLKFGFNVDRGEYSKFLNVDHLKHVKSVDLYSWFEDGCEYALFSVRETDDEDRVYDSLLPRRIEYVHQLQNLYFALTGEELTLKE